MVNVEDVSTVEELEVVKEDKFAMVDEVTLVADDAAFVVADDTALEGGAVVEDISVRGGDAAMGDATSLEDSAGSMLEDSAGSVLEDSAGSALEDEAGSVLEDDDPDTSLEAVAGVTSTGFKIIELGWDATRT